jgi:hypothetical protein
MELLNYLKIIIKNSIVPLISAVGYHRGMFAFVAAGSISALSQEAGARMILWPASGADRMLRAPDRSSGRTLAEFWSPGPVTGESIATWLTASNSLYWRWVGTGRQSRLHSRYRTAAVLS